MAAHMAATNNYTGGLTWTVFFVALVASSGGLLFGYDVGITGGVESMPAFLQRFFPTVYERQQADTSISPYCIFDDQGLQFFTSMWLAAMPVAPFSGDTSRAMPCGGACFLLGAALNAAAQSLAMLIAGRILLGCGVGCAYQAVPMYLSECAPFQHRGALNILFQLTTTVGILAAQLINYFVMNWDEGWRLSLGLAAVPALLLLGGGLFLPESPNSLLERGHHERALAVLRRLRGCCDVDAEFMDIAAAAEVAAGVSQLQAFCSLLQPKHRPALVISAMLPGLQQLVGINSIMFYVPILLKTMGAGQDAALLDTVVIGAINVSATFVAIALVDRLGRRVLLLEGGAQMLLSLCTMSALLGVHLDESTGSMAYGWALFGLVAICIYVAGFPWSWGPVGILVPSEVQPLELRSAAYVVTVVVNLSLTFLIGQVFLSMLCAMKYFIFLFFAGWVLVGLLFVAFLLVETKGVPLERMSAVFARHPVWGRVMGEAGKEELRREADLVAAAQSMYAEKGEEGKESEPASQEGQVVEVMAVSAEGM